MRPLSPSLSPNTTGQDVLEAIKETIFAWSYFSNGAIKTLEQWFRTTFHISYAISFNSGRSALVVLLKALEIGAGDEVILQAFTCVAVPNSVIFTDAKPIYTDINNQLTMDVKDLEGKITKKTKAIIVQHTFGIPADLEAIKKIAKKHHLFVIEDCAHVIGLTYRGRKLGTIGDASIFGFGRDKAFSSVFGGMVITNNKSLGKKIRILQKNLQAPGFFWTVQQLLHPIAFSIILPMYDFFFLGKILLVVLQKIGVLSFPVFDEEKQGRMKPSFIRKLPNQLARLALVQLKKMSEFNTKREEFSKLYAKELKSLPFDLPYGAKAPLLRFPILSTKKNELLTYCRKKGVYLGTWYSEVIDPKGVDFGKVYYERGSCPSAEQIAKKIINLPTYPTMTMKNARKVIQLLKQYVQNK